MLSSVIDDLQMQLGPGFLREVLFQVMFGLDDVLAASQFPSRGQAVNMRIDGKGGFAESLAHDNAGRFVPNARELFQVLEGARNLALVFTHQNFAHVANRDSFARTQAARSNDSLNFLDRLSLHIKRIIGQFPEKRRDAVDHFVRALRAEYHGH
jgi:hypothetical protein